MNKLSVMAGDICFTENNPLFDIPINLYQRVWSKDHKSKYGHCLTILDKLGTTFEALATVKMQNLYTAYKGEQVLIARHKDMTPKKALRGFKAVKGRLGQWYPAWRIVLMLIPPLARKLNLTGRGVCSETMYKQLSYALPEFNYKWNGKTPDNGADMVRDDTENWDIIFEGKLK